MVVQIPVVIDGMHVEATPCWNQTIMIKFDLNGVGDLGRYTQGLPAGPVISPCFVVS